MQRGVIFWRIIADDQRKNKVRAANTAKGRGPRFYGRTGPADGLAKRHKLDYIIVIFYDNPDKGLDNPAAVE
jgi:hypothetical protein